jgi:hypothetical protein
LHPSISVPFAQQPGTPQPPGTPPRPPPDPTAPRPYEEPPRPIPIPRPDEPPVVDDPPPRRNAQEFAGPLGPAHHKIGLPATTFGADQPLAPSSTGVFRHLPSSHLGGVGFDLRLAILAPNDQADLGRGSLPSVSGRPGLTLSSVLTEDKAYQL